MIKRFFKYCVVLSLCAGLAACGEKDDPFVPGTDPVIPEKPDIPETPTSVELPKKELRGAWVATVWEIDWPKSHHEEASQKKLYQDQLDLFERIGINAVFFQVRSKADAYYDSQYESWSKTITGTAGKDPGYDVLKWLIDETHKKGMQFHAWINPYRIETGTNGNFPELDPKIPKELTKDYQKFRVYNPALPEVRDRLCNIVKEIITKYDVDGIHMDDYFYPSLSSGESMNDEEEYKKYGSGYNSIEDFRRGNVSKMLQQMQKTIIDAKPEVIFSVSPQGNYDNNYNIQYIDVAKCCSAGWIDVIIPQLYFNETYFEPRLEWFAQNSGKSHLMVGYGIYMYGNKDGFSVSMFNSLYSKAKSKSKVEGALLYNTSSLMENKIGITDAIKGKFGEKVLLPYLGRGTENKPDKPSNVKISNSSLTWSSVSGAAYYAIFKLDSSKKKANLVGTSSSTSFKLTSAGVYYVSALSKENAESEISAPVSVDALN